MSLESVRKKVLKKAKEEAEAAIREAEAKAASNLAEARKQTSRDLEAAIERKRLELQGRLERRLAEVRRRHRMEILSEKNRLIDGIFEELKKRLEELSPEGYWKLIERWMGEISDGLSGSIHFSPEDTKLLPQGFFDRINTLRSSGKLTLGEPISTIERGFVFRSERFEMDESAGRRLEELRLEELMTLSQELFSEEGK